ncbi:hypothetical protein CS0771_15240 [Catellatospora sp. IY07-71]|uniref:hypothetical protein n=1 Tax=Catellatospora sp. IY07-71 TaxID=2728827 RepID=UPI001BB35069|nr:hypothetical protein [Catellatospora sp. IY07-71]BCJ71980.1 hypothetical protein CS0771_15240 [Catellatospora sp. IY07-71]
MRITFQRGLAGLAVLAAMAVAPVTPAHADDAPVARLTFSGDDHVAYNSAYAFTSTTAGMNMGVYLNDNGGRIFVSVYGPSEVWHKPQSGVTTDNFHLTLAAPSGEQLAVGTYQDAYRWGSGTANPTMELSGNGRGCWQLIGSFTVHQLTVVDGAVKKLDATFEQHCEMHTEVVRGRLLVGIDDMPPLTADRPVPEVNEAVALQTWLPTRSVLKMRVPQRRAVVTGTVTCSGGGTFTYRGAIVQDSSASGSYTGTGPCTGSPEPFTAHVVSTSGVPFRSGSASVTIEVFPTTDAYYLLGGEDRFLDMQYWATVGQPQSMNTGSAAAQDGPVAAEARPAGAVTGSHLLVRKPIRRH